MKTLKQTIPFLLAIAVAGFYFLFTNPVSAQTPAASMAPFQPVYLLREYMKVEPGQEAEYLKVEQVWKKVHQRRKEEGKIIDWALSRRMFPSGTNAGYDYMTTTVFKSGKETQEASQMTWDYINKGMSKEDLAIAENTEKTRKIVSRSMDYLIERVQPSAPYFQLTYLKANPGQGADLEKMEAMMNPVFVEACKMGKISAWRFGRHVYPISPESGNYYRVIGTNNLDDMLNTGSNNYIEAAFKKVYPKKDYALTMKAIRDMITIMQVDLWEGVDRLN